jgi:hypothetical protein
MMPAKKNRMGGIWEFGGWGTMGLGANKNTKMGIGGP